jgi:tetratricopeptide (TPR) repeat protein
MARRSFVGTILSIWLLTGCGASSVTPAEDPSRQTENADGAELFHRGEQAATSGDTVRAEQYLSMALDRGYSEKKVLPIMLRVCLSSSRLRAALNHAEPYLREHPNDKGLRFLVATIYLGLGQLDDARVELNHLLRLDSKFADAEYLLGVLESGANTDEAGSHFQKYLALQPKGEHAVEVRSRLTNLSVRVDMAETSAARSEPVLVPHQAAADSVQVPSPPVASSGPTWFGAASDSTLALPRPAGEP